MPGNTRKYWILFWDNSTLARGVLVCLLVVLFIQVQPLQAGDAMDRARIYGLGRESCNSYLKARHNPGFAEVTYKSWISGYLSARRGAGDHAFCDIGFASILALLDDYCQNHRQQSLFLAMEQLSTGQACSEPAGISRNQ